MIYEKGFMQGNFLRASECLALLYGLLSRYGVPEPKKRADLMLPGTNIDKARTMYEYLVDGYAHSVSYILCSSRVTKGTASLWGDTGFLSLTTLGIIRH